MKLLLNEYENLRELGQGSFAKIYKVRHIELDYIRAIRVLNSIVTSENDNSYLTFLNECKTLLQLGNGGHPNIVHIYQPRLLQNHALVEMDYIDGYDLDDYLKEQRNFLPIHEVMRFVKEISSALAYCHVDCFESLYNKNKTYEYKLDSNLKGKKFTIECDPNEGKKDILTDLQRRELINEYAITHNDLHSKNIMRKRYDGSYVLLDFGLAIQKGECIKSSSRRDGAVEYRPPEKSDMKSIISERSDIYSFGILMYEMLAGCVPFPFEREKYSSENQALWELELKHKNATPPAIEPLRHAAFTNAFRNDTYQKDYPDQLEQIILKCLEKNPENRYANAKELYEEIKTLAEEIDNREVRKLTSQNVALNKDLIDLSRERIELNEYIDIMERDYAQLEQSLKEVNEQIAAKEADQSEKEAAYHKEVSDLTAKNASLTKGLNDLLREKTEIIGQMDVLENNYIRLEKSLEEAKEKISSKEAAHNKEVSDLKAKNASLIKDLSALSGEKTELIGQMDVLDNNYARLAETLKDLKEQIVAKEAAHNKEINALKEDLKAQVESKEAALYAKEAAYITKEEAHNKEINAFKEKNESLTNDLNALSREKTELIGRMDVLENNAAQLKVSLKEAKAQIEDNELAHHKEVNDLKAINESLTIDINALSGMKTELIGQMDVLDHNYAQLEESLKVAKEKIETNEAAYNKEVSDLKSINESLRNELSVFLHEKTDLMGRIDALENDSAQLEESLKEANAQIAANESAHHKEVSDLKSINESLTNELSALSDKKTELTGQMGVLDNNYAQLEESLKEAKAQIEANEVAHHKEVSDLKSINESLTNDLSVLSVEKAGLINQMDDLKNNLDDQTKKIIEASDHKSKEIQKLETEKEKLYAANKKLTENNDKLKIENDNLSTSSNTDKNEIAGLRQMINKCESQLQQKENGIQAKNNEIKTLNQENEKLKGKINDQQKDISGLQKTNSKLKRPPRPPMPINKLLIAGCLLFAVLFALYLYKYYDQPKNELQDANNYDTTISAQKENIENLQEQLNNANYNYEQLQQENETLKTNLGKDMNDAERQKEIDRLSTENVRLQRNKDELDARMRQKNDSINTLKTDVEKWKTRALELNE